ncbi:Calponin-like actin-binding domain containing protein [Dorcoceras hygrometricum]|uniref:Calponin-like actin-binding domain containing protein n=1 Tax=Dorcoceras hygrometricum TaxID=472368 RepID=A0A2Z7C7U3_9LAMI|nr:Calponin-like actin-binding domain containing protein [Dorcoceras hygrometricum]
MKRSAKAEATSCGESADGLVVDDVIGDVIRSQESAGSLHSRRKRKRRRRGDPVASYSAISKCYLKIAKRCRLHKLIRQRFALAIKIQQEDFALLFQQSKLQCPVSSRKLQCNKQMLFGEERLQNDVVYITDETTVSSRNAKTSSRKKIQAKLLINQTQATAASSRELI